jgi:hypothetical protein
MRQAEYISVNAVKPIWQQMVAGTIELHKKAQKSA